MDKIKDLAKRLSDIQTNRLSMVKLSIKRLMDNNIRDIKLLEHYLDELLDLYLFFGTKEIEDLFGLLCDYVKNIDEELANDYLEIISQDLEGFIEFKQ